MRWKKPKLVWTITVKKKLTILVCNINKIKYKFIIILVNIKVPMLSCIHATSELCIAVRVETT